jgi:hypothetical protein
MDFDELYKSIILTEETVLQAVDEYTLYCYYTNLDPLIPGKAYHAPYYRKDNYPSFSIFESASPHVEYMWKDHATGESGTIFKLIQKVEQLNNTQEVLARINADFALGYDTANPVRKEKIIWYEKPILGEIKIRIVEQALSPKGIEFWSRLSIDKPLLDFYNTSQVRYYWTYQGQPAPITAPEPTFAYRIGEFYQLYSPYADKRYKFRNDLPENYFFGYMQLPPTGDKLIIDKSCKDVIFCRRLGYNAVCGKSETTMIPEPFILELKDRFKEIYLTLDPDPAGKLQTEKYIAKYPWMKVRFLDSAKDKTDLCNAVGFQEAEAIITQLLT